jgi:hypothetical protein
MNEGVPSTTPVRVRFESVSRAVHDLVLVGVVQGVGQPGGQLDRDRRRQLPRCIRVLDEVRAAQQLHGDVGDAAVLARVVDRDDVRMRQAPGHLRLPEELRARVLEFVAFELLRQRDCLQRHFAVDQRVPRPVHDAHRALADLAEDLVSTELRRQVRVRIRARTRRPRLMAAGRVEHDGVFDDRSHGLRGSIGREVGRLCRLRHSPGGRRPAC